MSTELAHFDLLPGFGERELQALLIAALDQGCSDIKIQSGDYVCVYWKRQWYPFTPRMLDDTEVEKVVRFLGGNAAITQLGGGGEIDEAPEFFRPNTRERIRLRLNAVSSRVGGSQNGVSITMRTIPKGLPELSNLNLPADLAEDLLPRRGLVLVVGATGSGKTTTIAGCLNERLKEKPAPCVMTYEEPPEFDYGKTGLGRGPLVSQVHVGKHIKDWSRAGPTAMRRKGDIILMGEVRDSETADATMEMAITGHGVYATLHADTPNEAIFRLVEMFPEQTRSAAASKMLSSLRLICAQKIERLLSGRVIMLASWIAIDSAIKDDLSSPENPYPRWAGYVRAHLQKTGRDFATQCIPYIRSGEMDEGIFRGITQMGRDETHVFFNRARSEAA